MSTVIVQYPTGPSFDMEYYTSKHMPLVLKTWKSHGMTGYKVAQINDPSAPIQVQCILFWDNHDSFDKAAGTPGAKEVFDDIPNFTEAKPVLMKATAVGES